MTFQLGPQFRFSFRILKSMFVWASLTVFWLEFILSLWRSRKSECVHLVYNHLLLFFKSYDTGVASKLFNLGAHCIHPLRHSWWNLVSTYYSWQRIPSSRMFVHPSLLSIICLLLEPVSTRLSLELFYMDDHIRSCLK